MKSDVTNDLKQLMAPLDPASPQRISDARLDMEAPPVEEILRRAHSATPSARPARFARAAWSRKRVLRWAVPGGLAVLAGGVVAATALLGSSPASVHNEVRCYSVGRLADDVHQYTDTTVASAPGQAQPDNAGRVGAALDSCSALWRIGLIQPGKIVTDAATMPSDQPVPHLAACVLTSGEAAVLPGDDHTCANLGLPRLADRQ